MIDAATSLRSASSNTGIEVIDSTRIIAILRGVFSGFELQIADILLQTGIKVMEVTLNSPDALLLIRNLAQHTKDQMLIGAGTVMTVKQVEEAEAAGARFIVSPNRNAAVIHRTKALGLLSFPGCLTCSEIVEAFEAGADAVKLFPAQMIGPKVLRALRSPLGEIRTILTGGITPEEIPAYSAAGGWAFGVGSELLNHGVTSADSLELLRSHATEFVIAARGKRIS